MAITQELELPSELPAAYVYLDDVRDIVDVLEQARASCHDEYLTTYLNREPVKFEIGNTKCDSLEDLQQMGGTKRNLVIRVGPMNVTIGTFESRTSLGALPSDTNWATYAKIYTIFRRRPRWTRNVTQALPSWLDLLLYAMLSSVGTIGLLISHHYENGSSSVSSGTIVSAIAFFLVIGFIGYRLFSYHSIAYLRYAHEGPGAVERIRAWASIIAPFLVLAIQQILQHYRR